MADSSIVTLVFMCCLHLTFATNITTTNFLRDLESESDTLVSDNADFKLGFFTPNNSTNRYVGVWFSAGESDAMEVVWVANRNNPINGSSGVLRISEDGNLRLSNRQNMTFWSSNVLSLEGGTYAKLLDTGNLVLVSADSEKIIWESFKHLTDSMLQQTALSLGSDMEGNPILRSWKSESDPSIGGFETGLYPRPNGEFITIMRGGEFHWQSGPWNGSHFLGMPFSGSNVFRITYDHNENTRNFLFPPLNESSHIYFKLNYDGDIVERMWDDDGRKWETRWRSNVTECDVFAKCGLFGRCNPNDSPICNCLDGFKPKNNDEWSKGNWTSGCVRKKPLRCGRTGSTQDGFSRLKNVKVPFFPTFESQNDQNNCSKKCLESCSCLAYAYRKDYGCMIWNEGYLVDIQVFSADGADVFVRLAHSDLGDSPNAPLKEKGGNNSKTIIIAVTLIVGTIICVVLAYCLWRWMNRRRGKKNTNRKTQIVDSEVDLAEFKDLPLFTFEELEVATKNFSEMNMLGRGGFGLVYKGKSENGQEIAVKRLSSVSGQGIQEFMNKVLVISKLQHNNLVKLLGCCVEKGEKVLVFECMPNKSLDALLFDSNHKQQLVWKKRINIIGGICRGLLYLHRDSRLKIIHRDLKASNILLDEHFNPKISDFGMARIFQNNQDQANTLRVVGTYGYMSPEYAMEGRFSEKSDVFSLGVLLLEIVSGRKNSSFLNNESLSLLTYAWKLWTDNDILSLIDPTIYDPLYKVEILKCIRLGLLCVQEYPEDRPTISNLISMLDANDDTDLPSPTQPGFTHRKMDSVHDIILQSSHEYGSINHVSLTAFSGR